MGSTLLHGDCLDVLRDMRPESVDAIVTDPPYGLGFMGKGWDAPGLEWAHEWAELCLRVLKPGGHLVAFGGTRTVHRLAVAIEDGGLEIRDMVTWLYWSGFPKSLDVSKAIDRAAGAEREVVGVAGRSGSGRMDGSGLAQGGEYHDTAPATPEAIRWNGWGTALKPAQEPAILARKPLIGTVADNVLTHGTGALNIDGCRFAVGDDAWPGPQEWAPLGWEKPRQMGYHGGRDDGSCAAVPNALGRFPANVYQCSKASRCEREAGCEGLGLVSARSGMGGGDMPIDDNGKARDCFSVTVRNHHPTVKPVRLMRWLCRLVTPPGGVVLDTFMGSGTTGVACCGEGFDFIGIEREREYMRIAAARIQHHATDRIDCPEWARPPLPEQPALWGAR